MVLCWQHHRRSRSFCRLRWQGVSRSRRDNCGNPWPNLQLYRTSSRALVRVMGVGHLLCHLYDHVWRSSPFRRYQHALGLGRTIALRHGVDSAGYRLWLELFLVFNRVGLLRAIPCQYIQDEGLPPHDHGNNHSYLHWYGHGMLCRIYNGSQYRMVECI